jgi:hypothetical protein
VKPSLVTPARSAGSAGAAAATPPGQLHPRADTGSNRNPVPPNSKPLAPVSAIGIRTGKPVPTNLKQSGINLDNFRCSELPPFPTSVPKPGQIGPVPRRR